MKKSLLLGMGLVSTTMLASYILLNKDTKKKADKLINNMLDKANNMSNK